MIHNILSHFNVVTSLVVVSILMSAARPVKADKSAVKMTMLDGMVDLTTLGPSPYELEGIASHVGKFQAPKLLHP